MTLGLTISLIPRFLGAAIFGITSDRYGRKWPFVVNCILLSILELCLAFCKKYTPFIICRALFGIAMGGIYGSATVTALEDCPEDARGLVAGIFQSGHPTGSCSELPYGERLIMEVKKEIGSISSILRPVLLSYSSYFEYASQRRSSSNTGSSLQMLAEI